MIDRRRFIQTGLFGAAVSALPAGEAALPDNKAKDPYRGLKMGVASYSLRKFSLDDAIAMTQKLGVKYITLKDCHLSLRTSAAEREAARRKIAVAGLILMGGGVIYLKND